MKMKKKMMFLFLLLQTIFGAANLYAQVTIGSDDEPHSGAILDLKSDNKGLKLPTVSLTDTAAFQLSTNPSDAASAIGMTVYNTNDDIIGGRGQGIYTWNGTWIYSGGAPRAAIPVNRIVITSPEGVNKVKVGETLKLTGSILPATASNKKLAWSVPWSSSLTAGKATVDDTGLVTTVKPGSVTVRASAIDGSGASRDFGLTILPIGTVTGINLSSETGADSVVAGRSLQLMVEIIPEIGLRTVKWEVDKPEFAAVSADGLVSGISEGNAVIRVSTLDGSDLQAQMAVKVVGKALPSSGIIVQKMGNRDYKTYNFGGTEWMIESSREGETTDTIYPGTSFVHYYYTHANKTTACKDGWQLPTIQQANDLMLYMSAMSTEEEFNCFQAYDHGGYVDSSGGVGWGALFAWLEEAGVCIYQGLEGNLRTNTYTNPPYRFSVRCVKPVPV
jgi:hypothetical protein